MKRFKERQQKDVYTCTYSCFFSFLLLLLLLLLCPQRHGPPGRGNTMALKDERSPKYAFPEAGTSLLKSPTKSLLFTFLEAGCWLAASCCTAAVALTAAASACVCCCCCGAAAIKQLPKQETAAAAAVAVPTKPRPSRTGKHHGPEGRMESKIGVSRGRNVPSEIS